jgi:hypothetical protein
MRDVIESSSTLQKRLSVVLSDPLRLKIVTELFMHAMSPKALIPVRGESCLAPFTNRVAKLFADPLCMTILTELSLRPMSPSEFHPGVRRGFQAEHIPPIRKADGTRPAGRSRTEVRRETPGGARAVLSGNRACGLR